MMSSVTVRHLCFIYSLSNIPKNHNLLFRQLHLRRRRTVGILTELHRPQEPVTHIQDSSQERSQKYFDFKLQKRETHSSGLLVVFSVPVSLETNGTRGAPLVLQCHHDLREKVALEQTSIYWQSDSGVVLHVFAKGKEEFQHQSQSFKNRTAIFRDQLPAGNFSLLINPLMLKDDQLSVEVAYIPESRTLCRTTVHVAVSFEVPDIKVNTKDMTAVCRTKGGFPRPELSWISTDHEGRTLEPPDVQTPEIHEDEDGTYSITSTASIDGLRRVSCRVYNPTSNETLSLTKDIPADEGGTVGTKALTGVLAALGVLGAVAAFGYKAYNKC